MCADATTKTDLRDAYPSIAVAYDFVVPSYQLLVLATLRHRLHCR